MWASTSATARWCTRRPPVTWSRWPASTRWAATTAAAGSPPDLSFLTPDGTPAALRDRGPGVSGLDVSTLGENTALKSERRSQESDVAQIWNWTWLTVAFLAELASLAALAAWGWSAGGSTATRVLLAVAAAGG